MRSTAKLSFAVVLLFAVLAAITSPAATYDANVRVQVLIEAKTSEGTFKDALYYSKAEYDALSDAQIEAAKATRVTNWVNAVKAAKTAPPPTFTKAELQAQLDELNKQAAELSAQATELSAKIAVAPEAVSK
jgi:hypothetical protein